MFLSGLGAPWLIASIYWEITDPLVGFNVKAAGLEFSTTLYIILGIIGRTGFVSHLKIVLCSISKAPFKSIKLRIMTKLKSCIQPYL